MHSKVFHPEALYGVTYEQAVCKGQEAADLIRERLLNDAPLMVARFGSVELQCFLNYHFIKMDGSLFSKSISYMKGKIGPFWLEEKSLRSMCNNAGFFPEDEKYLEQFYERMKQDMQSIDILGSWLKEEKVVDDLISKAIKVQLPDLEPYYNKRPWTKALEGKKVLVIHPYAESIQLQYKKRELLFENQDILPVFDLKTIKAVQSIAGSKTGYASWFEALDAMCEDVSKTDFDIAIIGCGAYGLSLAAYVKRIGKKAVHLGGATQILFGIKGKRWEEHEVISKLMNEHWVRPLQSEYPANYTNVEAGCYW